MQPNLLPLTETTMDSLIGDLVTVVIDSDLQGRDGIYCGTVRRFTTDGYVILDEVTRIRRGGDISNLRNRSLHIFGAASLRRMG